METSTPVKFLICPPRIQSMMCGVSRAEYQGNRATLVYTDGSSESASQGEFLFFCRHNSGKGTPMRYAIVYKYCYWYQNLRSAESQQILFAMDCTGRYIK